MTSAASPVRTWHVGLSLIALSSVPLVAGMFRLTQLLSGGEITPGNARFFAAPTPVMMHIVSVGVFVVAGAFQFAPRFRQRHPRWHRAAGRVFIPCGLIVALSALWMTLFYPRAQNGSALLECLNLIFAVAMGASIVFGLAAIRRRDIVRHRAWMIRSYAIGLGAGTQALILIPWSIVFEAPGELSRALLMGGGWMVNAGIAEWLVHRGSPTYSLRI
ncbi:MAG: DUF2306 domain-containing protein [Pseudomonadales bacterium]|nr:DUF2306 domain-containing protein [Pseudomonadales bacterium]